MSGDLPGYDAWKTHNPADDYCPHCGACMLRLDGWQPEDCTGECGRGWRDPDLEYEQRRDDEDLHFPDDGDDD